MADRRDRERAEAALDTIGQPGVRELAERAAAGDRALACLHPAQQRDTVNVLRVLAAEGGCSRTRGDEIARTIDRLVRWGLLETSGHGPWLFAVPTDRGRHLLAGMWAPPPKKKE